MTQTEPTRMGTCPRCRKQVAVTTKGNLYMHTKQDKATCPGSGGPPAPEGRGITFTTPDDVAEMLTDQRLDEMRVAAQTASQGRWGAWGASLMLSEDEDMNVDTAKHLADVYTTDTSGRLRTWDLAHIVNMQPLTAIALIEEVQRLRKARRDLAQAIVHTREYVDVDGTLLPPIEGWSWFDSLREHAPEFLPAVAKHEHDVSCSFGNPQCPSFAAPAQSPTRTAGMLHDEDPARERDWLDARSRPGHWRDDLAERFREYGWKRMAKFVERD